MTNKSTDELEEILLSLHNCERENTYECHRNVKEARQAINAKYISREAVLEAMGEDDKQVRGSTQDPANPKNWTKRATHRNELRAEIRLALNREEK